MGNRGGEKSALSSRPSNKGLSSSQSSIRTRDTLRYAWLSIFRTPWRSILTAIGALLGCAAFIIAVGLTSTVSNQVSSSFDVRRATEVEVRQNNQQPAERDDWFQADGQKSLRSLAGVSHAGRMVQIRQAPVRTSFVARGVNPNVDIFPMDADALRAVAPTLVKGRLFDEGNEQRGDRIALLSQSAYDKLGHIPLGSAVFIGDQGYVLGGVYKDVQRKPMLAGGMIVPLESASRDGLVRPGSTEREILITTVPGAAQQVGRQAPYALLPNDPTIFAIDAPPDPKSLRNEVEASTATLALLISLITLVIGVATIANATVVSVITRTSEIGLRRALGARRRDIFLQILSEAGFLGGLGGILGTALGGVVLVTISLLNRWVPTLSPGALSISLVAGFLAGLVAGIWPAIRATRIEPSAALTH